MSPASTRRSSPAANLVRVWPLAISTLHSPRLVIAFDQSSFNATFSATVLPHSRFMEPAVNAATLVQG
ncbi:hypothetical protein RRG08_043492 [Elysia crispata]|uniref:Uncharacterized protein n=1 Tax=Elysia crispata TaxID=231223 RepID=A0AAE1CYD3_9GAST|nr:hypothetical protein RRG08_043492 [Elysia crispata]